MTGIMRCLRKQLHKIKKMDIISGHAGIILGLLWCGRKLGQDQYVELAAQYGERLLELAIEEDGDISWCTGQSGEHLTGYAHGASGIASSLLELHVATGQMDYLKTSHLAMHYENKFYSEKHKNWLDLRQIAGRDQCSLAWCHGAPGILLSRLRAFHITGMKQYLKDAHIASETCFEAAELHLRSRSPDNCLCHGSAGIMLCLWEAGRFFNDQRLINRAEALAARMLAGWRSSGHWANAFSSLEDTPQLMLGYTGTAYSFMRLGGLGTLFPLHLANCEDNRSAGKLRHAL
jgi:lantibiotic modifying enzyme